MRKLCVLSFLGLFMSLSGCANIGSAMGGNTAMTGEAWYVKTTGMGGLIFSSKVFYCPQPNTAGPAQCKEAKMIEGK
ncbi:MAG: hypothetical protein JNM40_18830 [Myxococcales bacterium]|nr:hypothetical protein [Myxococcales bacterium]